MGKRFFVQRLPDGTIGASEAVICERIRERNWLYPDEGQTEIELASLEQVRERKSHHFDEGINEIPLGSIEFVEAFLSRTYDMNEPLNPILIPTELQSERYLGRRISIVRSAESANDVARKWNCKKVFLKSASKLKCDFAGVYDLEQDRLPEDSAIFLSEPLDIRSEWRAFIWRHRIVGIKNYAGDQWLLPDRDIAEEMVERYTAAPESYTLDMAVCWDKRIGQRRTTVVEVHNFISCGLYGFESPIRKMRWGASL